MAAKIRHKADAHLVSLEVSDSSGTEYQVKKIKEISLLIEATKNQISDVQMIIDERELKKKIGERVTFDDEIAFSRLESIKSLSKQLFDLEERLKNVKAGIFLEEADFNPSMLYLTPKAKREIFQSRYIHDCEDIRILKEKKSEKATENGIFDLEMEAEGR